MTAPLDGVRVLDFGVFGSAPKTGLILAYMGAEVIKVESPGNPDPYRGAGARAGNEGDEPWNLAVGVNCNNRGKASLCLDYLDPDGAEVLDRLIAQADVVMHNFRMSVADKVGLTWERCRAVNPRIVLVALSSQGTGGPHRNFASYGTTLEGLGGLSHLINAGHGPLITGVNFPDQASPLLASGAIAAAVAERDLTGEGAYLDFAQVEATAMLVSSEVNPPATPEPPTWDGVRFKGVIECLGEDAWVAIETTSDSETYALADTVQGDADGDLESAVRGWAATRGKFEAERLLRAARVPAAAVLHGPEVLEETVLAAHGYFERLEDALIGPGGQNGNPFGRGLHEGGTLPAARRLGADNRAILRGIAGLTDEEIAQLESRGIAADRPNP